MKLALLLAYLREWDAGGGVGLQNADSKKRMQATRIGIKELKPWLVGPASVFGEKPGVGLDDQFNPIG